MLVEAEIWSIARIGQDNAVLIRPVGTDVAVPIVIDQFQTQAILIGLGNVGLERPMTHDLLISMLASLNAKIGRVEITNLKDQTFYAQIILERDGESLVIDARPSDSIALAVRVKCPIFIAESVVESSADEISEITGETVEDLESGSIISGGKKDDKSDKDILEEKLKKAIEEENYEQAAILRDRLQEFTTGES